MINQVYKRDGTFQEFDLEKIANAIFKAARACGGNDRETAENVVSYMQTKFFHFLIALIKNTQQAMKKVYTFVPMQDFSKPWTDKELYSKYNLTQEEIQFIESMIRPMD